MRFIFMDESGYTPNWEDNIMEQPYYVLSAIILPIEKYLDACGKLRKAIKDLKIPKADKPLGLGFEIKAKHIARGTGWWSKHTDKRNEVRKIFLSFPKENDGVAIVVVIDKQAHVERYPTPENPYELALRFILERVQHYLEKVDDVGIVIYDLNNRLTERLSDYASALIRNGSDILKWTVFGLPFEFTLPIDRIIEFTFGISRNSIGLIVADFFATLTYQYHKEGKPTPCGWWDLLWESLDKSEDGKVEGYGYKIFP